MPRNTAKDDPAYLLMRGLTEGGSQSIENMEADGQRELVREGGTRLPIELHGASQRQLEILGFVLGPPVDGDPIFREGSLPDGWSIKATEHSMHSDLIDESGRKRGGIFYKAAYYDRCAHLSLDTRYQARTKYPEPGGARRAGIWDLEKQDWAFLGDPITGSDGWGSPEETTRDKWLNRNFPLHEDPLSYWGKE